MIRTPIAVNWEYFPSEFHPLLMDAQLFDSSCSRQARVYFIDKGEGLYLKTAPKGSLKKEAALTRFFHSKQLGAEVLAYAELEADWLLTRRIPGEDCIHMQYLDDPKQLCETTGMLLRQLHEMSTAGCPVPNRTQAYIETATKNYHHGQYDANLFPDNWGYRSAEDAWAVVQEYAPQLKTDTLLHGDYCLPNIILDDWHFSGFIDLDSAGVGDRHIDLFWGAWTLLFNLKTDVWCSRFLDAYGRDRIQPEILKAIAAFGVFG